jgi:hypothetical protein
VACGSHALLLWFERERGEGGFAREEETRARREDYRRERPEETDGRDEKICEGEDLRGRTRRQRGFAREARSERLKREESG